MYLRKPLVQFAPKSLLRHPMARSPIEDFLPDTNFKRVLPESGLAAKLPQNVNRLIFCCAGLFSRLLVISKPASEGRLSKRSAATWQQSMNTEGQ